MAQEGDILKVVSNSSNHSFMLGGKVVVIKYIGCGILHCKVHGGWNGKECIISESETVPVWDK